MNASPTFGQIVRERRLALGLTQAELARRVHCATVTIRKIEYDSLRPSVQVARRLAVSLNVDESEQKAFVRLARSDLPETPLPTPAPMPEEIGQKDLSGRSVLGYELGERIGAGGFGVVYRAVQRSVDREVAVKIILPQYANQPPFIRRFESEAQTVAQLEHPYIVPLYDYWREPDAAYLIMRFLRGGSLETRLRQGPISLQDAQKYLHQVCQGLHLAHRHGLVHRDIKPANVLLDEDRNAYLSDFGIAKYLDIRMHGNKKDESASAGSPAYAAPEELRSEPARPETDIYSLGILLYEMLAGERPFPGPTPALYARQHLYQPLPSLAAKNPSLPPVADAILLKATAKDAGERYSGVPAFLEALQAVWTTVDGLAVAADRGAAALPVLSVRELAELENPYKGLRAFSEADSENFFGRDNLVHDMLGRVGQSANGRQNLTRFLAVVGPSGSGKSSVVKAGLIPALRQGGVPGSEDWFVVDMIPGPRPISELASALMRVAVHPPHDMTEQLRSDERGLLRVVNQILPADESTELLLVIDQFEEIYTLVEDEAVRVQFLDSLVTAILDEDSRLRIVVTMRADFLDRPLQYVDFAELIRQRTEFVPPLNADELEEAITQPLLRLGMALEPGLPARIIHDVGDEPGKLPLLQYALTELFEQRSGALLTREAYEASGGVLGALGSRADETYANLDPQAQEAARQVFLRLVTLGEGTGVTRRRVPHSELHGLSGDGAPSRYQEPIDAFGRFRLLTFDRDPETREPTVEVAHEALLSEWGRLDDWLAESRHDMRMQRLLAAGAREWSIAGNDPSYALRGSRLAQFEDWAADSNMALTEDERSFLEASIAARRQRQAEEEARRQRELETARHLAETERKRAEEQATSAQTLRRRAIFLGVALALALLLAIAAIVFGRQSAQNAELAASREAEAVTEAGRRATAQAFAENQQATAVAEGQRADRERDAAIAAEATAQVEAIVRATAEAQANQERQIAEQQADIALSRELAAAALQTLEKDPERSILLAMQSLANTYTVEAEEALHQAIQASRVRQTFRAPGDLSTQYVTVHPDGSRIFASGQNGGAMWDTATGAVVFTQTVAGIDDLPPDYVTLEWINRADFSPDGTLLAVPNEAWAEDVSLPGTITLLASDTGEELFTFTAHTGLVYDVTFNPEGTQLASIGLDKEVKIWDVATSLESGTGVTTTTLCCHEEGPWGIATAFSPDGQRLVSIADDGSVIMWDLLTEQVLFSTNLQAVLTDVVFSPDGRYVVVGPRYTGFVYFLDSELGSIHSTTATGGAEMVRFSPDGSRMATSHADGTAKIWDYADGELGTTPMILSGHTHWVNGLSFSPDGRYVVTGSWDRTARLWDVTTDGAGEYGRYQHEARVWEVSFSPEGDWLASASADGTAIIWDSSAREVLFTLMGHEGNVRGLAIHPNGRTLATVADDGIARLWDARTGEEVLRFQAHEVQTIGDWLGANSVAFSPSGDWMATGGGDQRVRVWDAATGELLFDLAGHTDQVNSVIFSPDGRFLASAGSDQTIKIWDAAAGQELWSLSDIPNIIWKMAFSHDSSRLAVGHNSGDAGGLVVVWQLPGPDASPEAEPELVLQFEHNTGWVAGVNFSPDDFVLVAPGLNRVSLHHAQTGDAIIDLFQSPGAMDASFSPDGRIVALAGNDGSVRLMAADLHELLHLAQSRLTRELTTEECQEYLHMDECPQQEELSDG